MNLKNLRIVVDEREKKSGIPDLLKGTGINLEIKTLPVGDYIVAPETIVERKTVSDLVSSIFDGRLFDQCHRLKEHYQFPILIIEGDIDEIEELTENPLVFYGAISSIAIDFKIPVIPTPNATHTSKLLISMCSRKDASKGPFIKKIRKSNDLQKTTTFYAVQFTWCRRKNCYTYAREVWNTFEGIKLINYRTF